MGKASQDGSEDGVATFFTISKAIMGAGGFAIPWAFARMGYIGGPAVIAAVCVLGCNSIFELLAVKQRVEEQGLIRGATYVDLARAAFASLGAHMVFMFTQVTVFGALAAYLVFVATTVQSLDERIPERLVVCSMAAMMLPIVFLKDFSVVSRMAGVGTWAVVIGYVVTILYGFTSPSLADERDQGLRGLPAVGSWRSMAAGFGPVAFLFCIQLFVPAFASVSRASRHPGEFEKIAFCALVVAAVINGSFGFAGLVCFRTDVSDIVVKDISDGSWYFVVVKVLLCIDLMCTYPLIFVAGRELMEALVLPEAFQDKQKLTTYGAADGLHVEQTDFKSCFVEAGPCMVRLVMVMGTVALSQLDNFGELVSVVGSFASVSGAFVLPPLMSLAVLGHEMSWARYGANVALLGAGVMTCAVCTAVTIEAMFA